MFCLLTCVLIQLANISGLEKWRWMQTKAKGGINQIDSDVSAMSSNAVSNMLMAQRMINTEAALAEASVWLIHTLWC